MTKSQEKKGKENEDPPEDGPQKEPKKAGGRKASKSGDERTEGKNARSKGDGSGGEAEEATAGKAPDRVLLFADTLRGDSPEEEKEEQELETWVSCRVEEEIFALPVRQVQEILRVSTLTRVPHAPFPVRGVTNMRGHVLPVVDLRIRLGLEPVDPGPRSRIVVVLSRGRLIGLLVDSVDQVLEIDRLRVEDPPDDILTERSYYLLGVYHREEDLVILLDVDRVLEVRDVDDEALGAKG